MRWNIEPTDTQGPWTLWFAWYPVKISGQWVWWENIERSYVYGHPGWTSNGYAYRNAIGEGSPVDTAMQAAYTGEKGSPAAVAGTEGGLAIEPRLPRESEGRRGG